MTNATIELMTYERTSFDFEAMLDDQRKFAKEVDGIDLNPDGLKLPAIRSGFGWGLWTPQGWTAQREYEATAAMGIEVSKYTNDSLDIAVPKNNRTATGGQYLVLCRAGQEADEQMRGISANDVNARGLNTMPLAERLRLGRWFYWKTGQHLDVRDWTRCAGSRDSGGGVPCVRFSGGGVHVRWSSPGGDFGSIRARETVSAIG